MLATACTPAHADEFGIAKFEAGTCNSDSLVKECSYTSPEAQFYTKAAGHPPIGLTGFEVNTEHGLVGGAPIGNVRDVRVDIPPGLSVNPQATCSASELAENTCAGKGQCTQEQAAISLAGCPAASVVGSDELDASIAGLVEIQHLSLPMYNLVPPTGVPAEFGIEINAGIVDLKVRIVGGLSWYHEPTTSENAGVPTGDYHEYFTIKNLPNTVGIVKTRLKFNGMAGNGTFITLPSVCSTQTSYLHVDSYEDPGNFLGYSTVSGEPPKAVEVSGCGEVPFAPSLSLAGESENPAIDQPEGGSFDLHVPQSESAATLNSSDIDNARVVLPEGLTLNPSAANGLGVCTEAQIGIGGNAPVACPSTSQIGTVAIETPVLPPGSLRGGLYIGDPSGGPITGPPFTVYLAAESEKYAVGVRLRGVVEPDRNTGQLTAIFNENPQLPFEDFSFKLNGGPRAPLATPLVCAPMPLSGLTPYTTLMPIDVALSSPFSPGEGSKCQTSAPFVLSQATQSSSANAGAYTSYTFSLARGDGQQYLSQVKTVLPPGLVGAIPSVPLCKEPQAASGSCPTGSLIGSASAVAGAGSDPFPFSGSVYLTGPYGGAPYGLSIVIPAVAGPFNFGNVITRAGISVDEHTGRVIVTSALPTVVQGVPLRLRAIDVQVNRGKFLFNPSNCGGLTTETTLTSTLGDTQSLSSPFQVGNCKALAFKPTFKASTGAKTSRANGASLKVTLTQPAHQANIHSVFVKLPKQLPARLTTLQKACPETTFAANPKDCPPGSRVGSATVETPVLPDKLTGVAYFVSHGGAAFPDLDLVLDGDGVQVVLVGNTEIKNGVTSSTFASVPDVPVSSFSLNLPIGPHSVLGGHGNLCVLKLQMPTTIVAQSGAQIKQSTKISVTGCGVQILRHKVNGKKVRLTIETFGAGRVKIGGAGLRGVSRKLAKARKLTLTVPLSASGEGKLFSSKKGKLKVKLQVAFAPASTRSKKSGTGTASKASAALVFKR